MSGSKLASLLLFVLCFAVASASAQTQAQSQPSQPQTPQVSATPAAPPPAKPADVSSPDAILAATYDVISGPPGIRDWDRFRSLFVSGARLIAVQKGKDGNLGARVLTPEDYISHAGPYFEKNGFFEREASRHADRYGNIMQIFSTYESRHDAKDAAPFARGINSFQLFFDGARWWVVTIYWEEETPHTPLPKEFLPAAH
ncbi:MAG: hypothetical protein ABSB66_01535 [Candidatus Acidiferrales bacterium]|jgi:hypothetical protein